ncbi:MAG: hypothetical protein CV087_22400 [Candidatus Brocadia sp. WS118]|nr:MAG: hypothetical protein CV087_22400 [Candidatus Brocadia sp. WS118]
MKSALKRKFKFQEKELRKIINSWNLIPGSPADEFDALNHLLLGHLGRENGKEKMVKVIYSELITNYGLTIKQADAEAYATQIVDWWTNIQ